MQDWIDNNKEIARISDELQLGIFEDGESNNFARMEVMARALSDLRASLAEMFRWLLSGKWIKPFLLVLLWVSFFVCRYVLFWWLVPFLEPTMLKYSINKRLFEANLDRDLEEYVIVYCEQEDLPFTFRMEMLKVLKSFFLYYKINTIERIISSKMPFCDETFLPRTSLSGIPTHMRKLRLFIKKDMTKRLEECCRDVIEDIKDLKFRAQQLQSESNQFELIRMHEIMRLLQEHKSQNKKDFDEIPGILAKSNWQGTDKQKIGNFVDYIKKCSKDGAFRKDLSKEDKEELNRQLSKITLHRESISILDRASGLGNYYFISLRTSNQYCAIFFLLSI
jgi:hypothetical protein